MLQPEKIAVNRQRPLHMVGKKTDAMCQEFIAAKARKAHLIYAIQGTLGPGYAFAGWRPVLAEVA